MKRWAIVFLLIWSSCKSTVGLYEANGLGEASTSLCLYSDSSYIVRYHFDRRCNCPTAGMGFWRQSGEKLFLKDRLADKALKIDVYEQQFDTVKNSKIHIFNLEGLNDFPILEIWESGKAIDYSLSVNDSFGEIDSFRIKYSIPQGDKVISLRSDIYVPERSSGSQIRIAVHKPAFQEYIFLSDTLTIKGSTLRDNSGHEVYRKIK